MSKLLFGLSTLSLLLFACDEEEKDTGKAADTRDTSDTSDTSDTNDTNDTNDTSSSSDVDGDGVDADSDCNDNDGSVYPGAEDMVGDGIDNNCDGIDGLDTDRDGFAAISSGGDDCDDTNPDRNPGATEVDGDFVDQDCSFLALHLDTSCSGATSVQMTGPWWGWDPLGGPVATDLDGDGIFTVEFENILDESLEYKWVVDGDFEADLTGAGFCADVTNPSQNFANRLWLPGDGDTIEYPGTCFACGQTDWSSQQPVTIDLYTDASAAAARIIGPWWNNWDPNSGPEGTKIADGHFQFTFDPAPGENMEFIFSVDGENESLVAVFNAAAGPTCNAINTDYANYFNRFWLTGSGDQCYEFNSCGACQ